MNFAAAGDFPLGIVPGFRYNETESDISGAEEKMLKFKIMLVVFIALVYYGVTYCMLSPGICKYYADYYLLSARSFSIDEERAFLHKPRHMEHGQHGADVVQAAAGLFFRLA